MRLARALVDERPAAVVVGEGVVVGHRDYGPVSRVRRLGDGALRVECRGGSFLLRPASCSTDVVLAVLRALSSVLSEITLTSFRTCVQVDFPVRAQSARSTGSVAPTRDLQPQTPAKKAKKVPRDGTFKVARFSRIRLLESW